jgi:undecaprenyl-diphosphatase
MKRLWIFLAGLALFFVSLFFLDRPVAFFFTSFRNPVFDFLAVFLASTYVQIFIFFVVPFFVLWFRDRKRAVVFGVGMAFVVFFTYSLKYLIGRPRPFMVLSLPLVASLSYHFGAFNTSLPSSHASTSFSAFAALEKYKFLMWLWLSLAVIVIMSRLYDGVHYLSDVVFGAMLGYFVTYGVFWLDKKYGFSRKWKMV